LIRGTDLLTARVGAEKTCLHDWKRFQRSLVDAVVLADDDDVAVVVLVDRRNGRCLSSKGEEEAVGERARTRIKNSCRIGVLCQ
jgi:hypothetical protein